MQIKYIITLALFGAASAAPLATADIPSSMTAISSALGTLDKSVKDLSTVSEASALSTKFEKIKVNSKGVIDAINTAKGVVSTSADIGPLQAAGIIAPAQALSKSAGIAVDDLISAKAILIKNGQG